MKKEYNFSKGERGQFFNNDAHFNLPIDSDKKIQIEKLPEGVYLTTGNDIPYYGDSLLNILNYRP